MASWGFRHPRGEDLDLLWDFGTAIPMSVRDSSLATGSPSKEPKDESCCRERVNENVCGPQMHFQIYPWPSCYCCLHYTIWNCGKAKQGQGPVLLFLWSSYNQIWKVQLDHCISHKWKCIAHFTVFENQQKCLIIFTSAILLCRLLVLAPDKCMCSNRFWSNSIWSLALAFCTLSWAFWSSNSRSLLVTQSLMRAAFASTAFASARRKAL